MTGLSLFPLLLSEFSQTVLDFRATVKRRRSSACYGGNIINAAQKSSKEADTPFSVDDRCGTQAFRQGVEFIARELGGQ